VAVGAAAGWLDDAEPQAATRDVAATALVSQATRSARPRVLAAITRLAPAEPAVCVLSVIGARAGEREDVDMECSFVRRKG
jgi:hypothetical protein